MALVTLDYPYYFKEKIFSFSVEVVYEFSSKIDNIINNFNQVNVGIERDNLNFIFRLGSRRIINVNVNQEIHAITGYSKDEMRTFLSLLKDKYQFND